MQTFTSGRSERVKRKSKPSRTQKGLSRLSSTSACFLEARNGFSRLFRRVINILGKTVIVHRLRSLAHHEESAPVAVNRGRPWYPRESLERTVRESAYYVSAPWPWTRNQLRRNETKRSFLSFFFFFFFQRNNVRAIVIFLLLQELNYRLDTFSKIDRRRNFAQCQLMLTDFNDIKR